MESAPAAQSAKSFGGEPYCGGAVPAYPQQSYPQQNHPQRRGADRAALSTATNNDRIIRIVVDDEWW